MSGVRFGATARSVKKLKRQELEQKCEQAKKVVERRPGINQDELATSLGYSPWKAKDKRRRRNEQVKLVLERLQKQGYVLYRDPFAKSGEPPRIYPPGYQKRNRPLFEPAKLDAQRVCRSFCELPADYYKSRGVPNPRTNTVAEQNSSDRADKPNLARRTMLPRHLYRPINPVKKMSNHSVSNHNGNGAAPRFDLANEPIAIVETTGGDPVSVPDGVEAEVKIQPQSQLAKRKRRSSKETQAAVEDAITELMALGLPVTIGEVKARTRVSGNFFSRYPEHRSKVQKAASLAMQGQEQIHKPLVVVSNVLGGIAFENGAGLRSEGKVGSAAKSVQGCGALLKAEVEPAANLASSNGNGKNGNGHAAGEPLL